jgi:hypothetical protein
MSANDGGPAFPGNGEQFIDGPQGRMAQSAWGMDGAKGMSLRDYLAAKAMQGLIVDPQRVDQSREECARLSYLMADAMIMERAK